MFSIITILLLMSTASLAAGHNHIDMRCGPSSNCETVISNGTPHHRFKRGLGPGSPDYISRFRTHEARNDPVKTYITLGKSKIGWGCGQPLGPIFDKGIREVCGAHGCAEDTSYSQDVPWVDADRSFDKMGNRKLVLKAKGEYDQTSQLEKYIKAFNATATPDTVGTENREWCGKPYDPRKDACSEPKSCPMRMFPSFIKITRFQKGNLMDHVDITVQTDKGKDECLAENLLAAIGGAIDPLAGGFFGVASAFCSNE